MFLFSSWNPSIIHISSVFKNKNISNILLICNWRNELLEIYVFLLRVISKEILQLSLDPDAVSENVDQVSHTNFPNPGRIWGWGGRVGFWNLMDGTTHRELSSRAPGPDGGSSRDSLSTWRTPWTPQTRCGPHQSTITISSLTETFPQDDFKIQS